MYTYIYICIHIYIYIYIYGYIHTYTYTYVCMLLVCFSFNVLYLGLSICFILSRCLLSFYVSTLSYNSRELATCCGSYFNVDIAVSAPHWSAATSERSPGLDQTDISDRRACKLLFCIS